MSVTDLRDTIVPKSDQLNAEQLLAGPITITVTEVLRGDTAEQPVTIHYTGDNGRPYKPCKTSRKVLIFAWGEDGTAWVGRSMTLYNNPDVMFGGVKVGGIRISALSHIRGDLELSLTATRGKKNRVVVKRMDVTDPAADARVVLTNAAENGAEALSAAWKTLNGQARKALGGCPQELKDRAAAVDSARARAATPATEKAPAPAAPPAGPADDDGGVF